jgi:hypothetical protein
MIRLPFLVSHPGSAFVPIQLLFPFGEQGLGNILDTVNATPHLVSGIDAVLVPDKEFSISLEYNIL